LASPFGRSLPTGFAFRSLARTRGQALAVLVVSSLAVVLALAAYGELLLASTSSTGPLVFIFLPLYQHVTAGLLLAVLFFMSLRKQRNS